MLKAEVLERRLAGRVRVWMLEVEACRLQDGVWSRRYGGRKLEFIE